MTFLIYRLIKDLKNEEFKEQESTPHLQSEIVALKERQL